MASEIFLNVFSNDDTGTRAAMDERGDLCVAQRDSIQCRCPKCGKTHFLKFFWTGNGTPRKYCHRCREAISGLGDAFDCRIDMDSHRVLSGAAMME